MPNRMLRDAILTSDRVNALSFEAEVFYRRLMSKVDDFGLMDARLAVLRSDLFGLRVDRVFEADIQNWMDECVAAGLLNCYSVAGKPYLQMLDTKWAIRAKEPKYPLPPDCAADMDIDAGVTAPEVAEQPDLLTGIDDDGCDVAKWVPPPSNQKFSMSVAWEPSPSLDMHCRTSGVARAGSIEFNQVLSDTRLYWMARQHEQRTQLDWDRTMLTGLVRQKNMSARSVARPPDRVDKPPHGGVGRTGVTDSRNYGQVGVGVL